MEASEASGPPTEPSELTDGFKKDELQTAAAVQGVDVPSGATKQEIAEAIVEQAKPQAQPVRVDNLSRRSDDDALEGTFVRIVDGEHEGRVGAFVKVAHHGADGYPETIIFRSRDAEDETFAVPYSSVRPAGDYHGGR